MKRESVNNPPALPIDKRVYKLREYPQMTAKEAMNLIKKSCGKIIVEKFCDKSYLLNGDILIFLPMATREFKNMVYWGGWHPINKDEQIYQGMGHIFKDGNKRVIIISHFLYIYAAKRTPVEASITNGTYDSIMSRIEYERDIYNKNEKACNKTPDGFLYDPFIGLAGPSEAVLYGHTHPNLGCFFSPPDRVSGFAAPDFPAVTFVADPIRKEMKAGVGLELKDALICVCNYEKSIGFGEFQKEAACSLKADKLKSDGKAEMVDAKKEPHVNDSVDDLLSVIGRTCNEILNPMYGAKGKYTSYTTLTGAQKVKMELTYKPGKEVIKSKNKKAVGTAYDSYA